MFTTPCFIRKNTPELIKKLQDMGYFYTYYHKGSGIYCYNNIAQTFTYNNEIPKECIGIPKDNEELFLALAALRDDTPINSWYWFNSRLIKCETLELKNLSFNTAQYLPKCRDVNNPMICFCVDEKLLRKATINEIIEHFKNR